MATICSNVQTDLVPLNCSDEKITERFQMPRVVPTPPQRKKEKKYERKGKMKKEKKKGRKKFCML